MVHIQPETQSTVFYISTLSTIIAVLWLFVIIWSILYVDRSRSNQTDIRDAAKKLSNAADKVSEAAGRIPMHRNFNPYHYLLGFYNTWGTTTQVITARCTRCGKTNRLKSTSLEGVKCGGCHQFFMEPTSTKAN